VLIAAKRGSGIEKAAYGGEESMMDGEEVVVCVCVGVWSLEDEDEDVFVAGNGPMGLQEQEQEQERMERTIEAKS
jgi:hypothetical protein